MAGLDQVARNDLIYAVGQTQQFQDFGIAFVGKGMCTVIKEPQLPEGYQAWVVFKEEASILSKAAPQISDQSSSFGSELIDMGLSCGSAVLAGGAAVTATGAAPLTAGTSLAFTYLSMVAAVASAAQCGYTAGRVFNELFSPDSNTILDRSQWVQLTTQSLDAIALAGGLASLGQGAKAAIRLSRSSGKSLRQVVQGLNRAERKRLAQDLARYAGKANTRKQFLRLANQGKLSKIFSRHQISQAVVHHFIDSLGASLTISGSFRSGVTNKVISVYFVD